MLFPVEDEGLAALIGFSNAPRSLRTGCSKFDDELEKSLVVSELMAYRLGANLCDIALVAL